MTKTLFTLLCIFIFSVSAFCQKVQEFTLSIEQNRTPVSAKFMVASIDPAPFDIVFKFNQPMGVMLAATFDKEMFELAKSAPMGDMEAFVGGGMAEGIFNEKKLIMVASDAVNYWYFQAADDHRFDDAVVGDDGSITCYRRIENIEDIYGDWVMIREATKTLYLIAISVDGEEEVQRELLEVRFNQ